MLLLLLLLLIISATAYGQTSPCYVSTTSSIRRAVVTVIPQVTLPGCKILCTADPTCQATLLNAAGTACIILGAEVSDPTTNACPAPFTSYAKTTSGCVPLPQTSMAVNYTPGECSSSSDVIGDLATNGTAPTCGSPPLAQRRLIIDAIQHDGSHIVLENYYVSVAVWDGDVGSWYLDLVETPNNERYYFSAAKCVLAPVDPLTPNCACAPLPTEPADPGNSNPTTPVIDLVPSCASGWVQMEYLHVTGAKTYDSAYKYITCTMGVWMMIKTNSAYNSYALSAATFDEMIELSLSMNRLVLFAAFLSIAFAVSSTDKAEREKINKEFEEKIASYSEEGRVAARKFYALFDQKLSRAEIRAASEKLQATLPDKVKKELETIQPLKDGRLMTSSEFFDSMGIN